MNKSQKLKPTADPIYKTLKESIMSGSFAPGEPLRQDDIARLHGVSKIPVREALLRLEVDGFVQFRKNKGAIVREVSATELLHLMDIRIALECMAIELAIPNIIASDLISAESILDEYSEQTDLKLWSDLNIRFHDTLYEPCGNAPLLQMISDLRNRLGPQTRLLVTEISGRERPQSEHYDILAACKEADVKLTVKLVRQHIETTKKEIAAGLRRLL